MFFSRFIKKLDPATKEKIRLRLAMLYAAIAWNGFAIGIYMISNKHRESPGVPKGFTRILGSQTEESQVIRIKGFNVVERTVYDKKQLDEIRQNIINPPNTANDDDDNNNDDSDF
ncbi:hypothetical protein HZH68_008686 [Vespula germanica]|uniref:Uncharacterized protein n=1 Tax=Vespula germanica TaxID=30212 RepID=A0A834JZB1_VESGE|nr:hypothetical protein HZH68_008686 [Vespula germanica]